MNEFTTPQGTRDLVIDECYTRRKLRIELEDVFARWGYQEVITPMIEYYNTFSMADMKEEEMYKILDASGRILTLRPDMTIPIARVAATKFKDAKGPLRFMHCSNVFKVNEQLHGNKNESCDCGIELIGVEEPCGDLEVLNCAFDALRILGDIRYTLEIGNLNFFHAACKDLNISKQEQEQLADLVNRKSLKSLEDFVNTLDISDDMKAFFNKLPWLNGSVEILNEARAYAFNEELVNTLNQLEQLCGQLKALGYDDVVTIDLGKVPSLNYYTGLIFEAFVEGVGISILSGGRYDELLKRFGKDLPAIGFAVRLDALLDIIQRKDSRKRIVLEYSSKHCLEALRKAQVLRENFIVELAINEDIDEVRTRKDVEAC